MCRVILHFPPAYAICCYCLSVSVCGRKPAGTEDLSKQPKESPEKSDQDDNFRWTTGLRRLKLRLRQIWFWSRCLGGIKKRNSQVVGCRTEQPFEIGEIGIRIVPTRAVCNLLRSLCVCCAQTLKNECGTLWTSRIWTIEQWECAGDRVGLNCMPACMHDAEIRQTDLSMMRAIA